jgi:hypothetical protein
MADHGIYLVEVTSDDRPPKREFWLAAFPRQDAVRAVLEAIPEGWAAKLAPLRMTRDEAQRLKMLPGTVRKLR